MTARSRPEVLREQEQLYREEQAAREAERFDRDIKRAYMEIPGATEDGWATSKDTLLQAARERQAEANQARARRSQGQLYRSF